MSKTAYLNIMTDEIFLFLWAHCLI